MDELGDDPSTVPIINDLDLQEDPDRKFQYDETTLLKFKTELEKRHAQDKTSKAASGGFGSFGGAAEAVEEQESSSFVLIDE